MAAKKATKKSTKVAKTAAKPARGKAWTFPKNTLEDALRIARVIEDKNAGNPWPAKEVAKAVGFNQSTDWRFLDLLRSANLYGMVSGSGAAASIELTKLGQDIVAPSSPGQRSVALFEAFKSVDDFRKVEEFYGGKRIPEDEFFLNTVTRQFDIPRDRVETFSSVFQKNLNFLNAFSPTLENKSNSESSPVEVIDDPKDDRKKSTVIVKKNPRGREFLDSCFVMMPFGHWFDIYYHKIYVPAINEAGFEPIRGDELFTTGSVVEQIWEQIEKSTVLLADLSGRNANVFYELGLAHAARKPVVFTAGNIDDVPFDLRHLRVITYEPREPDWADKLKENISEYLRNAAKEPEKSIPNPFRPLPTS